MAEKKIPKINTPSDQLSNSDTLDKEADLQLHTLEEERVQTNPSVERGPPRKPKIKKLSRDKAEEKGTQTKDKEKQT